MKTELYAHKIIYNWDEDDAVDNRQLNDDDIQEIINCLAEGYREGELCQSFTNINKETDEPFDDEVRGWWKIAK